MSLGINALWRARPQRRLGLLIPRESPIVLRTPSIRPPVTGFLFSTRAPLDFPKTTKDLGAVGQGEEEVERQQDDANEPREAPPARRVEVVGRSEEARELGAWLSEAPKRERKKTKRPKNDLDKLEESLERSKLAKSVFVKPARTYPSKRQSRESWREHQASISTQVYFDRNVQNLQREGIYVNPDSTDWRHVLSLLATKTPEESAEWIEDGMKIELPERKFAAIMNDGGDEKIGAIRRRTGASIKVSRADSPTASSALLVSGTRVAINSATAEFRRIAGRITITRLWAPLGPDEVETETFSDGDFFVPPLTREEGGPWRRFRVDHNAYTTPWPKDMSFSSFEHYVASLTDSVMLPHLNSVLYNPTRHAVLLDHERAVARRLLRAFMNYEARPWISCAALKLALSFLCRHGDKYLPEARSIFVIMDRFGLRMDADVFNMLLRAPATARNLRKFRSTILLMTRKGFSPNLDTWIMFLRMFDSVEVKSYVLQAMHSKNLLGTPEAIQRVAEEMAPFDTEHAMSEGKDLATFMQEQDDRYTPDWLTRDAANQVIDVLCRHRRFQDAFEVVDRMHAYVESIPAEDEAYRLAHRPDVVTFNTIISHAKTDGKMPVAVNVIRKMRTTASATQPDRYTFELLFEIAWKSRLRYSLSVIWKYASLARLTTWRMRQRVASLLSGELKTVDERGRRGMSASTYAQLGGEMLARDLVGGERALARIRSLAEGRHNAELGVLAAQCWPVAFDEYGPRISLAYVLPQAVVRDLACLAKKNKRRNNAAADAAAAPAEDPRLFMACAMMLRQRGRAEAALGDLSPLEDEGPEPIAAGDRWGLVEMLAPGKKQLVALSAAPLRTSGGDTPAAALLDQETDLPEEQEEEEEDPEHQVLPLPPLYRTKRKGVAVLDPGVWGDLWRGKPQQGHDAEAGAEAREPPRHKLQISNEDDILAALGRLEEKFLSFRKVVTVADDEASEWSADERARHAWGEEVESEWRTIMATETSWGGDAEGAGGAGKGD